MPDLSQESLISVIVASWELGNGPATAHPGRSEPASLAHLIEIRVSMGMPGIAAVEARHHE